MAKDKTKKKDKSKDKSEKKEKKEGVSLRIELNEDSSAFSFKIGGKELETSIGKVSAVLGAGGSQAKNFVLLAVKGRVVLIGYNPDTYVYLLMKTGEANGDGNFAFQAPVVQGVVKNRAEMEFTFKNGDVTFKDTKSKYNGTFHTQSVASDQVTVINAKFVRQAEKEAKDKEEAKRLKIHAPAPTILPRTVLDCLKEGVALTGIKDIYSGNALLSYMVLDEKGILSVYAFSGHHFGIYRVKVDAGGMTFKAAMPSSHFLIIDRMVEGTEAKFHVMDESVRVEGDGFTLILPSTQVDPRNYEGVPNFVKALPEAPFKAKYSNEKMMQLADNLFTLHSVNTLFEISHKDESGQLDVTFKTQNGSASDSLKVELIKKKNAKVKVDPRLLRDIMNLFKTQKETTFSMIPGQVVRIEAKTALGARAALMCALSN